MQTPLTFNYPSLVLRLLLCLSGFYLLGAVSGGPYALIIIGLCTLITYGLSYILSVNADSKYIYFVGRISVPVALLSIVLLNINGLIGTLTGSVDFTQQSYVLLLAAPFYFLSAAAFVSDVALRKLPLPSFLDYMTYLTLPFKLLAGPLEAPRLLGKIKKLRPRFTWWRFSAAWPWIALGLVMKFVIANRLFPSNNIANTQPFAMIITATEVAPLV
jgi:D-alanyl-lipoteichoic acid acyltransferase DltB (MBOAT superfamily)